MTDDAQRVPGYGRLTPPPPRHSAPERPGAAPAFDRSLVRALRGLCGIGVADRPRRRIVAVPPMQAGQEGAAMSAYYNEHRPARLRYGCAISYRRWPHRSQWRHRREGHSRCCRQMLLVIQVTSSRGSASGPSRSSAGYDERRVDRLLPVSTFQRGRQKRRGF